MTRTSLVLATAAAALTTASFLTTDADARVQAVRHTVSHPVSRPVQHFGVRTTRSRAATPTVAHRSFSRSTFGHRNHNASNAQSTKNAGVHPKLSPTSSQAHPGSAPLVLDKNHIAKTGTSNLQNTANADLKAGNADIKQANVLAANAAALQAKAKTEPANKAALDLQLAKMELKLAAKTNNRGQNLLRTGTAEFSLLHGNPTPAQIAQVQQSVAANLQHGNAAINQANALRASAAALQAKAKIDAAKGDRAEAGSDLARANAALAQAAKLDKQGQAFLANAQNESAAIKNINANTGNPNTAGTGNPSTANAGNVSNTQNPSTPGTAQAAPSNPGQVASVATATSPAVPARSAQTASPPSVTGSFKALSLAWNANGGWVVRTADALDAARQDAMTTCNSQFGGCQQATAIDNSALGCLAVMSNSDHKLAASVRPTLEAATRAVQSKFESSGQKGELVYSGCNNG